MADSPPDRDTDVGPDHGPKPGTPRWVKVFGIIAIVVVVLVIIMLLAGGGHGPGRHTPSGGLGGHTPSSGHENTGGVGGPANADEAARTVEVTTLDTMAFEPSRTNVSAGETVRFAVTNTGHAVHEFTAGMRGQIAVT